MNQGELNAALRQRAQLGTPSEVSQLISEGAEIDSQNIDGWTALYIAAMHERLDNVEMLIRHGANTHLPDKDGRTVLHAAIAGCDGQILGTLIDAGADVNAHDKRGFSPLHSTMMYSLNSLSHRLIQNGADQFAHDDLGATPWDDKDPDNRLFTEGERFTNPAVQAALENPWPAELSKRVLLELCSARCLGELFLHGKWQGREVEALRFARELKDRLPPYWQERFDAMVDLAPLRREAPVDKTSAVARYLAQKPKEKGQMNPLNDQLHTVAANGKLPVVLELLAKGAEVDSQDPSGWTALHWAADRGHYKVAKALVAAGANVNLPDHKGLMPLHLLTRRRPSTKRVDMTVMLMQNGADRYATDHQGRKPTDVRHDDFDIIWQKDGWEFIGKAATRALKAERPAGLEKHILLELCSARRIGELFIHGKWVGHEKEALAYAKAVKAELPPYWQERFDTMVDLAPLRREADSDKIGNSAVGRYLAQHSKRDGRQK